MTRDLRVDLGPLALGNPVLTAAGTFGYGIEFAPTVRVAELGAIITKTITIEPRAGNPPPRLLETPSGMLNAVGLQNVGLESFLRDKLPQILRLPVPVIVSVLGERAEEIEQLCRALDATGVHGIELNLSCPNIHRHHGSEGHGGLMVSQDPSTTAEFVAAARAATRKPLIAKLTPDVTDIRPIAQAAERAGADVLSLCNTYTGMSLDPDTGASRLGSPTGGLSGPAIRPLSLYRLWRAREAVRCPLIGVGGIITAEDALEYFHAGASAVAVGTGTFAHPDTAVRVARGLRRYLERHGQVSFR